MNDPTSELRRSNQRLATRELIINAARKRFALDGYAAVTLRRIAQDIGCTAPAIYRHFSSKESLMQEICIEDFRLFAAQFQSATEIADPTQRLRAIGVTYVRFGITHPHHYRVMFMTESPMLPSAENLKERGDPSQDAYAFLSQTLRHAIDAGALQTRGASLDLLAQTFWAAVHGVVTLELHRDPKDPWIEWCSIEERTKVMTDAIVRAFLPTDAFTEDR